MRARRAAALLAVLALAACGEKDEPDAARVQAVTGAVDLERPPAAPPDAGTEAGHRAPDAVATTRRKALAFRGRVAPPSSRVTLARAGGKAAAVDVGANGRFRARARGLRRGANRFVLKGSAPGLRPLRIDVTITRR